MSLFRFSARLTSILIGLTLTALVIAFQLSPHGTFGYEQLNKFDGIFYDLRLKATLQYRENFNDTKILIIDIDEKTMREQGRFPWSRFKTAELVDRLFEAGVIVIAFDVMFSEQEQNPIELIYQRHPDKLELQGWHPELRDCCLVYVFRDSLMGMIASFVFVSSFNQICYWAICIRRYKINTFLR